MNIRNKALIRRFLRVNTRGKTVLFLFNSELYLLALKATVKFISIKQRFFTALPFDLPRG